MGMGLTIFLNKTKKVGGVNDCCNAGGCWGKLASIFPETAFFQRNLNLIKSKKIPHTLCNHDVSTKSICTYISYFVNICKDDFY